MFLRLVAHRTDARLLSWCSLFVALGVGVLALQACEDLSPRSPDGEGFCCPVSDQGCGCSLTGGFTAVEGLCGYGLCDVGSSNWIAEIDEHGCHVLRPKPSYTCSCNCGPPPRPIDSGPPPVDADTLVSDGSTDGSVSEAGVDDGSVSEAGVDDAGWSEAGADDASAR